MGTALPRMVRVTLVISVLLGCSCSTACGEGSPLQQAHEIVVALYGDMLKSLPAQYKYGGMTVDLYIDPTPGVNASAAIIDGRWAIAVRPDFLAATASLSYYIALERVKGRREADRVFEATVLEASANHLLMRGILPLPKNYEVDLNDEAFRQVWLRSFRSISCYVLGHELGHHFLGHTGSVAAKLHLDPRAQKRTLLHRHLQAQREELESDTFGIYAVGWNRLDYAAALTFCRFMSLLEPRVKWSYVTDHPRWESRAKYLERIVKAL